MLRKCMGCMEDYDDEYEVCPHCGYVEGTDTKESIHLCPTSILNKKYIVGKVLGHGGFGVTYLGWDAVLEKKVAIKEYFPNEFATRAHGEEKLTIYSGDKREQFESGLDKFMQESKCLAKLQDVEGIVRINDCFEQNNTAYIVMEYLEGHTLKELIEEKGKFEVEEAIVMIKPILEALECAHQEGIIHRDIAPDNIFVTNEGKVKVIDFGASRFATTKHSKSLSVILKPGYSPEEQYRSMGDQGPWTDVYSVAATFYKMISGVTPEDAMERSAIDRLKEPSKLGVKLEKNTENSIMNALNVKIEGRTKSAKEFLCDLEAEEVKRIKVKNRKMDIGRMPMWVKFVSVAAMLALIVFCGLIATGTIRFTTKKLEANQVPLGYARVPNVINMPVEQAQKKCDSNSIVFQIYSKEYSNNIEEGKVLGQHMYGGSIVEEGTTLLVLSSAGAEKVIVPNVVGMMESDAEGVLNETDLVFSSAYVESSIKPSAVVSQSLEADSVVEAGSSMDIEVSIGMSYDITVDTIVPDLVDVSFDEAIGIVRDSALYIYKVRSEYSESKEKGIILSQSLEAGTTAKQGDVIEVVVSLGVETILVPDIQYSDINEAKQILEEKGFVVSVEYVDDDAVLKDHVVSQSLEANTLVNKGSVIVLKVSNGNDKASIDAENITADSFVTQEQQQAYDEQFAVETPTTENVANSDNNEGTDNNSNSGGATTSAPATTEAQYEGVDTVETTTMPNLIGQSEAQALQVLSSNGLIGMVSYIHDESKQTGNVISQSIGVNTSVIKGSVVNLTVCNNEKKTQYRTRSISEETVTSSVDYLEGWTLYDQDSSWSSYGAFSNWSTDVAYSSDSRNVESKTQYRYQDKETTTATSTSLSGWTLESSTPISTTYSGWSGNQTTTTKPTEGDLLRITNTSSSTTYNYYHYDNTYTNGTKGIDSVSSGSNSSGTIQKNNAYHTYSTTTPLSKVSMQDIGGKQAYGSHACAYKWNYWFLKDSVTTTTYTYQTRTATNTYSFYRWTSLSDWSDTAYYSSATRWVETRTVYRYQDRSLITTYYHKRNVYGDWSGWSDTPAVSSDALDVETKEVFVY
ncbi:MAG: PASTA domain-containing protein [Eubacteriales bacterium]|nr:PASTA domain-containing protein [Eubacteriales bacterium]